MFNKFLSIVIITALVSCSSNPVSVEKISSFDLSNYETFSVEVAGEEVKVSPFTKSGLKENLLSNLQIWV